jgi:hypothetical protein
MTLLGDIGNIIGLIGSIIGLLVLCGSFLFWLHKKTLGLKISKSANSSTIKVTILNKRDFNVEIEYIRLIRKSSFSNKYKFDESSFFHLVESEEFGFRSTQDDKLNILITPQDPIFVFDVPFSNIFNLYHHFIDYKNSDVHQIGELKKSTKMQPCCIGIFLKGGKCVSVDIDPSFYNYYKHQIGAYYNRDLSILKGECSVVFGFDNNESYRRYKNKLLNSYEVSKRNKYLLYK